MATMIWFFLLFFIFIVVLSIIYYTYQMTHNATTVFLFITLICIIFIITQPDIAEIENVFDDIFDDLNDFQINQTDKANTSSEHKNEPIVFDTNLLYFLFIPWIFMFLFLFVVKPIYKYKQRRVKTSKKASPRKKEYKKRVIEKQKEKIRTRVVTSPPNEIGDYKLIENISKAEIENVKKQYQQIGHWVQIYNFHDSKHLYISKWTKHEKGIYGKPKWIKTA